MKSSDGYTVNGILLITPVSKITDKCEEKNEAKSAKQSFATKYFELFLCVFLAINTPLY